jgi:hypothetical protein
LNPYFAVGLVAKKQYRLSVSGYFLAESILKYVEV